MKKTLILGLVMLGGSLNVAAEWKEEPAAVAGIAINKPLTSSLEKCTKKTPADKTCYFRGEFDAPEKFSLKGPEMKPFLNPKVYTADGKSTGNVEFVQFVFSTPNYPAVREILTKKYGAPHALSTNSKGEVLEWKGKDVTIQAIQESFSYYESYVDMYMHIGELKITARALQERKAQAHKMQVEGAASRL